MALGLALLNEGVYHRERAKKNRLITASNGKTTGYFKPRPELRLEGQEHAISKA